VHLYIEKLIEDRGSAIGARHRRHQAGRDRSDLWSEYSTWLYVLPGIKSVCPFPVFTLVTNVSFQVSSNYVRLFLLSPDRSPSS
jgi:hypothetical protein